VSSDGPGALLLPAGCEDLRLRPSEFAKLVGQSRQGIHDHIKRGNLTVDGDGRMPLARALRQLDGNLDPARRRHRGPLALAAQREIALLRAEIERLAKEVDASRVQLAAHRAGVEAAVQATTNSMDDAYSTKIGGLCAEIVANFDALVVSHHQGVLEDALDSIVGKVIYGVEPADDDE
jgi:hypothetical protein